MYHFVALLISTLISSFCVYPLELWRLRRQIYPILKRYYSYLWRLQAMDKIGKRKRVVEECFIDEFGWSIFARGFTVELISNIALVSLVYIILGGDYLFSSVPTRQRYEFAHNLPSATSPRLLLAAIVISFLSTYIDYHSQQLKIAYQFNEQEYITNTGSNRQPYSQIQKQQQKQQNNDDQNQYYRINLYEVGMKEVFRNEVLLQYPLNSMGAFQKYTVQLISNLTYYLSFTVIYCILVGYQQYHYTMNAMIANVSGVAVNSHREQFIGYIIQYLVYRSPIFPIMIASIIAVLLTHRFIVFQTQVQCFTFAFRQLQSLIDLISSYDEGTLLAFPKKLAKCYSRYKNEGIFGRLLYFPLRLMVISLWFDFLLSQ